MIRGSYMTFKKINELKVGEEVLGFYLIKESNVKTTSNNKKFMDMTLVDKTGDINAKLWEIADEQENIYSPNNIIKIKGLVNEWQGKLQLKIDKIRLVTENDEINVEDYIPSAPIKPEVMLNEIFEFVEKIENNDIKKLTSKCIEENKEKLLVYPAAKKNHHAIRSGLLYHILRMLKTAEKLREVYPQINNDLLFAGVILHDMAKIQEMDASEIGIVSDYTMEGHLLGHITQGIKNIDRLSRELGIDEEVSILIQHMILSHHYEPEFGSPKRPMIPEAELLHYIDMIDARMYDMFNVLENTETKGFSDKVWVLHNRMLYKTGYDKEDNFKL